MVHRYMFVSCCYPVHFTTELIYQNEFHIQHGKLVMCLLVSLLEGGQILEKSTPLCNGKGSNADKVQDSETSLLVSKKADKNYLDDSERTQKSCLDVVFELLATTAGTSSSNSLPESVRLLESQLQVERHRSDVMRQEAEGLRKSLQNSDAYFLVQQQALEDLSAKQEKVNKLAKHLASIMGTQDIVS